MTQWRYPTTQRYLNYLHDSTRKKKKNHKLIWTCTYVYSNKNTGRGLRLCSRSSFSMHLNDSSVAGYLPSRIKTKTLRSFVRTSSAEEQKALPDWSWRLISMRACGVWQMMRKDKSTDEVSSLICSHNFFFFGHISLKTQSQGFWHISGAEVKAPATLAVYTDQLHKSKTCRKTRWPWWRPQAETCLSINKVVQYTTSVAQVLILFVTSHGHWGSVTQWLITLLEMEESVTLTIVMLRELELTVLCSSSSLCVAWELHGTGVSGAAAAALNMENQQRGREEERERRGERESLRRGSTMHCGSLTADLWTVDPGRLPWSLMSSEVGSTQNVMHRERPGNGEEHTVFMKARQQWTQ